MDIFLDWSFLAPFLSKAIISALVIGVIGLLIGQFAVYREPEDDM